MSERNPAWPKLSARVDGGTIAALHLFSQVIGKVPTALLPWRNHGWHLTLHLTPRGLRTEPIHAAAGTFELMLDLIDGVALLDQGGERLSLKLAGRSVASFHQDVETMLADAGHAVRLNGAPNEIDPAIPFADDVAPRDFDPDSA